MLPGVAIDGGDTRMKAHAALGPCATELEKGFAGVAEQLNHVRAGMTDLSGRLGELDRVLNQQSTQDQVIDRIAARTGEVREALVAASAVAMAEHTVAASRTAESAVAVIETQMRMLDAVANLSLITAQSLGMAGFDDYVSHLRSLGTQMRRDAAQVGASLSALQQGRRRAGTLYDHAGSALSEVSAALDQHSRQRRESAQLFAASIGGVGAAAAPLPRLLTAETDALVQALQFADAAAQRIDHIRTILGRGGAGELALAGAQIAALVRATQDTVSRLRTSLSRIESAADASARVLVAEDGGVANPAARALDLSRKLMTTLGKASERAFGAIDSAATESAALNSLASEATQRVASLTGATRAIHLAAVNASLLSRNDGGHQRAMSVLSIDVQQQAAACAKAAASCGEAMVQLTRADDLALFSAVWDRAQGFRHSVTDTAEAVAANEQAMAAMDALRRAAGESLQALLPAIAQAHKALERIAMSTDTLADLAEDLPPHPPPGSGPLDELLDLYTMEAERAVHRKLFGLPDPNAHAPAPQPRSTADAEGDPLASILF